MIAFSREEEFFWMPDDSSLRKENIIVLVQMPAVPVSVRVELKASWNNKNNWSYGGTWLIWKLASNDWNRDDCDLEKLY